MTQKEKQFSFYDEEGFDESDFEITQSAEAECYKCGLYRKVNSPKMKPTGKGKKKCLIVAEAAGSNEDKKGKQLVGQAGQRKRAELKKYGLDLDRDFWKTNSLACRPFEKTEFGTKNRPPTRQELAYCKPLVDKAIKKYNPEFIWLLGSKAIESFYMKHFKNTLVSLWRGLCIPDRKTGAYILPMHHPSYIIRNEKDANLISVWERDVKNATDSLSLKPFNFPDENKQVTCLYTFDDVRNILDKVIEERPEYLVFDYEGTGLKPYSPGHKISTISLCYNENMAYSFPFDFKDYWSPLMFKQIKKRWCKILSDPEIGKIAQNIKFEDVWTSQLLKTKVKNWTWDTMLAAHILDNRSGYTSLNFQVYSNFGMLPYDTEIKQYLESQTANSFNKIEKAPLDKLLHYGGLDSLFPFKLFNKQTQQFEDDYDHGNTGKKQLIDAYYLLHDGTLALSKVEQNGICTNEAYYHLLSTKEGTGELDKRIVKLEKYLREGKEAQKFKEVTGKTLNKNSGKDLGALLYGILKLPPTLTKKGNYVTDKDALAKLKSPFAEKLLLYRKLEKVRGTYIAQFVRESYNGIMHPIGNLNIPVTYRGSVERPSFQNIPKRDEEAKKYTRSGIIPTKGWKILESDFSGIEVATSTCYNKDKNLIKYVSAAENNMHRDSAADIWKLKQKEVTREIRFYAKNQWVFPEFYGDWYSSCARNLWDTCIKLKLDSGITLGQHLRKNGIPNYNAFVEHCKEVERIFWNERFPHYKKWKKKINQLYRKQGYIETYLGFVFRGHMSQNDCTNYQAQGCLQKDSLVQTKKGWIKIKDLVGKKVEVWTGFSWKRAIGVDRGKAELVNVYLDSGLTIKCDVRHKFKNEKDEWIKFKNLKVEDYVALPKTQKQLNKKEYTIGWSFILGFIVGDGSYQAKKISEKYTRHIMDICGAKTKRKQLKEIFNFLLKEKRKGFCVRWYNRPQKEKNRQTKYIIELEGKIFAEKMKYFGILPNKNHATKRIPEKIWCLSQKEQQDFLWGLWLSDGARHPSSNKCLHMNNLPLLKEIQILAYGIGYDTYWKKTPTAWCLHFMSINRNSRSTRKFPLEVLKRAIGNKAVPYNGTNESTVDRRTCTSEKDTSQVITERAINKVNPSFKIYRYDKVTKIEKLHKLRNTYTMMVDDPLHQFVADGVICKNTAFHILLWTLIELLKEIEKRKLKTRVVGQIHDSIINDLYPPEEEEIIYLINDIGTVRVRKEFDWIIVPLKIDHEITDIDGSWYDKKEIKLAA